MLGELKIIVGVSLAIASANSGSTLRNNINETKFGELYQSHLLPTEDRFWWQAFDTMSYHRNMMNEYLCRRYLADEIINSTMRRPIDKKMGQPTVDVRPIRQALLEDSGSSKYKDWLSRSNTLEDIYRHYEGQFPDSENLIKQSWKTTTENNVAASGYAYGRGKYSGYSHEFEDLEHSGYGYNPYDHDQDYEYEDKGLKLKEIFDLSLTAIAFLAFGTFMTEVLIYAFGVQNQETQMMIVSPMPTSPSILLKTNHDEIPLPEAAKVSNGRRISDNTMNEISRRVLSSIEAITIANRDGGNCLRRVLCESNKFSRSLSGIKKIWLPLWSFGVSWIVGKFVKSDDYSLLENLKAGFLGYSDGNCASLYSKCVEFLRKRR